MDNYTKLISGDWHWTHHDKNEWKSIPDVEELSFRDQLFLFPAQTANLIDSKPLQISPREQKDTPSKEKPVLYKEFLRLDGTPESFLEFANQYGHLFVKEISLIGDSPSQDMQPVIRTSSLSEWNFEHWLLKTSDALWRAIQAESDQELKNIIYRMPATDKEGPGEIFVVTQVENWQDYPITKECFEPLFRIIEEPFNKLRVFYSNSKQIMGISCRTGEWSRSLTLHNIAQWFLLWIAKGQVREYPSPMTLCYRQKAGFEQRLWPENLLAAMWLQFMQVVSGERRIEMCKICGSWSDITDEKKGKKPWDRHRECANKDAVTKSRKLPSVRQLRSEGKDLSEIAKQLKINERDALRWLDESEVK